MKFRVIIEPDEDDVLVAYCPALPGCISHGRYYREGDPLIPEALDRWKVLYELPVT